MKTRKLGLLDVSELGFGCMNLATNYGPAASIDDAIQVIREAHNNGVTFFDTAEDRITVLAKIKGATTAQLSLAWLLARKPFIVPIPGTGKVKHLQENIESAKLLLTADDLKATAGALSEFKVHGGRMNEQQMKVVEQ